MTSTEASFELWDNFREHGYVPAKEFFQLGRTMIQTYSMSDEEVIESVGEELNMHLELAYDRVEMIDYRNYN